MRSPPAKRQRISPPGVVDLCSPDGEGNSGGQRAVPLGRANTAETCRLLLADVLQFSDALGASAPGKLQPSQRLAALRSLLLAIGGSMPALLLR